mmetsp:Transcript_19858/g.34747  ORF Transcript_19858/g.34747 Transcript_19858/m.34747 type:complete len:100 (-) Transcript_19858:54-353(-)
MMHCFAMTYAAFASSDPMLLQILGAPFSKWPKAVASSVTFVAAPLAEALHPSRKTSSSARGFDVAGLTQYITVGTYILFFGLYSVDFYRLRAFAAPRSE